MNELLPVDKDNPQQENEHQMRVCNEKQRNTMLEGKWHRSRRKKYERRSEASESKKYISEPDGIHAKVVQTFIPVQ